MRTNASFAEAVFVAFAGLRSSKLRTFLTLLGIILATTTLIAVMSVIHGMNKYVAQIITEEVGADAFHMERVMMVGERDPKKWVEMRRRNPALTTEEFQFLKSNVTMVKAIGMQAFRGVPVQANGERVEGVLLRGTSPSLGIISGMQVAQGRFLIDIDDRQHLPVAFIGADVKQRLFPTVDAVGKTLDVQGRRFEIVGAAKPRGSVFGESQDNYVAIPIGTYFKIYGSRQGIAFHGLAIDHEHLYQAQDQARMLLRAYRHLGPGQEDNFGIATSDSLIAMWERLTAAIAATAVAVVSVFMVVGGVVIMNIMLAVVTERTHEIGIRKSVGARRADILMQFLVESAVMAGTGGLIGVLLAWAIAAIVRGFTPVPMQLPVYAVFVGVTLSAAVGLFFGIYPARQASKLDPIVALRAET